MNAPSLKVNECGPVAHAGSAVTARDLSAFALAARLFDEVGQLPKGPTDIAYSDALMQRGFQALQVALAAATDDNDNDIADCASALEHCSRMRTVMRNHLSNTLLAVSNGVLSKHVALAILEAVVARTTRGIIVDCLRTVASDGLGDIADAIAASSNDTKH